MYDLSLKVKTVCLTSRNPRIVDEAIANAIPKNANVVNYIFCVADGHYFCHILYHETPEYGYYGNNVMIEPMSPNPCKGCDK